MNNRHIYILRTELLDEKVYSPKFEECKTDREQTPCLFFNISLSLYIPLKLEPQWFPLLEKVVVGSLFEQHCHHH